MQHSDHFPSCVGAQSLQRNSPNSRAQLLLTIQVNTPRVPRLQGGKDPSWKRIQGSVVASISIWNLNKHGRNKHKSLTTFLCILTNCSCTQCCFLSKQWLTRNGLRGTTWTSLNIRQWHKPGFAWKYNMLQFLFYLSIPFNPYSAWYWRKYFP